MSNGPAFPERRGGPTGRQRVPLSADIKAKARELGFDDCGIAPAADLPELRFFAEWIRQGYGATMAYLDRSADLRSDVRRVMPSARTVIVTVTVYNTSRPYSVECTDSSRAHVARYAWGDDYHDVVRRRLDALLDWMRTVTPEPFEAKVYVDTGPIQERVYAQHAGLGWVGRNTCLIHPTLGSWVFLGEIVCSLALDVDTPALDQCGTCTLCVEACPTGALVAPGVLDSNRCVSYLTIEHRGEMPAALSSSVHNFVYGCDVCQEVCPWNAVAPQSSDPHWQPRPEWDRPRVVDLLQMDDTSIRAALKGSAMKRAKVGGLRRNIAVVARNTGRLEESHTPESDGSG